MKLELVPVEFDVEYNRFHRKKRGYQINVVAGFLNSAQCTCY